MKYDTWNRVRHVVEICRVTLYFESKKKEAFEDDELTVEIE